MSKPGFDLIAAYHEVGHATIAHRLGVEVLSVSLFSDGGGLTKFKRLGRGERAILITLAGPYAQRCYAPKSRWRWRNHLGFLPRGERAYDFDIVADLIGRMHDDERVARAYRPYVEARAEALVEQHWKQIEHLARDLMQHGTMTGEEMKASWWEKEIAPKLRTEKVSP